MLTVVTENINSVFASANKKVYGRVVTLPFVPEVWDKDRYVSLHFCFPSYDSLHYMLAPYTRNWQKYEGRQTESLTTLLHILVQLPGVVWDTMQERVTLFTTQSSFGSAMLMVMT